MERTDDLVDLYVQENKMTKPETRLVYDHNDLASLFTGDRVRLWCSSFGEDEFNLAVYENLPGRKMSFITQVMGGGDDIYSKLIFDDRSISYDGEGGIELDEPYEEEIISISNSDPLDIEGDLLLRKQAGLYKDNNGGKFD